MIGLFDSLFLTLERLWQQRVLALWALVGLATATTLALSLSLYVDAVNTGLLAAQLSDPPYAFRFRYLGSWNGNIGPQDVENASAAIQEGFTGTVHLPTLHDIRFVRGLPRSLRLDAMALGTYSLGLLEGAEDQIEIVEGQWPPDAEAAAIPVLLSETMLYKMGLQVGDKLTATLGGEPVLTLKVAALWKPRNPADTGWIFPPRFFDEVILLAPATFWPTLGDNTAAVEEVAWQLSFDGRGVRTSDVDDLLRRMTDGQRDILATLPSIRLDVSPEENLKAFNQEVARLTQQLAAIVLPVGGLVLYFVTLIAALLVSRQQAEDVTLFSRGMSRWAILSIHVLLWLLLTGTALLIGIAASFGVVRIVGQTVSFLRFDASLSTLPVVLTPEALAFGAITGLVAASSGLYNAWRSSAQTITGLKRQKARAGRAWWQRSYLDVLLFIPAVYVLYTLNQQQGLAARVEDPFSDPLVFLGPALFSLSLTLLFLRLWPRLLQVGAWLLHYTNDIAALMALRELGRSIERYRGTLLMMCFTLSLLGFTASMASTLDKSLNDVIDYQLGADIVLTPAADAITESNPNADPNQPQVTVTGYNTLPAEDLLKIPGVAYVSPVGRYSARLVLPSQRVDGTIMGIDRAALAAVALFREDYAQSSLAELLNRLAGNRTGILISQQTADTYNLKLGQEITLQVSALNEWYETRVPIVGILEYFPTLNPQQGFFAITNLQPLFELIGSQLAHDIWLKLAPDADAAAVQQAVRELGYPIIRWAERDTLLRTAQAAPSRRGVLGFLSVGFVAAIALTLVGAIVQSTASFHAQAAQLGALRAMGLGGAAVTLYLILLQSIASLSGIISGTSIGVGTALLFLPLLDFSGGLPPYQVRVAWTDILLVYGLFAVVLLAVPLLSALLMGRQRIANVLKLGDA